jgi:gamma-glutamyltranspeptidase
VLIMEKGFNIGVLNQLRKIGYKVDAPELHGNSYTPTGSYIGQVQSIIKNGNKFSGYADERRTGSKALGY